MTMKTQVRQLLVAFDHLSEMRRIFAGTVMRRIFAGTVSYKDHDRIYRLYQRAINRYHDLGGL